jgi:hypothetical protein
MKRSNFFDSFFGEADFFNSPFFSLGRMHISPKMDEGFPKEGDPNFNKTEENVETENHTIKKEIWTSLDGSQRFERSSMVSKLDKNALPKAPTKKEVQALLDAAVEKQDFEEAIKLRDQLKNLE